MADSSEEAENIAINLGNGRDPDWPTIDRYNTADRTPVTFTFVELEHGQ